MACSKKKLIQRINEFMELPGMWAYNKLAKGTQKLGDALNFRGYEFLTPSETKQKAYEVQKDFNIAMNDISKHAQDVKEFMSTINKEDGTDIVRALDGSLNPENLSQTNKNIYSNIRQAIDDNAKKLVEMGLLQSDYVIQDYVKRIYENHKSTADVVKNNLGKFFSRKNLSYEKRLELKQILDPRVVVPYTLYAQEKQLALGAFYKTLAEKFGVTEPTEGYVRIQDINVGGGIKKYGDLSGKYVAKEIYDMLNSMKDFKDLNNKLLETAYLYGKLVDHTKVNITVKNPAVHIYNISSNSSLAFLNGDLPALFEVMTMFVSDRNGFNALLDKANSHGLNSFLNDFDPKDLGVTLDNKTDIKTLPMVFMLKILKNTYGAKGSAVGDGLRKLYEWEDKIFKLASFKKLLDMGLDEKEAYKQASEVYVDYTTPLPNVWRFLDKSGLVPFIHYTYKATPATLKVIAKNPVKFLALQAALHLLGAGFGNEDDDYSKPSWAADQANLFGAKEWARLGESDWFLNIGRAIPGFRMGFPNFNASWLNYSGGLVGGVLSILSGKTPLGYDLGSKYDDLGEGSLKRVGALGENYAPLLYGRYGQRMLAAALGNYKKNYYDEDLKMNEIILRMFGIRHFNSNKELQKKYKEIDGWLKSRLKNNPSHKEEEAIYKEYNKKLADLTKESKGAGRWY